MRVAIALAPRFVDRVASGSRARGFAALSAVEQQRHCDVLPDERKAASWALVTYLRDRGFTTAEAAAVQRGSPGFARKLAMLAKDEIGAADARISIKEFKALSSRLLLEQRMNVGEAVIESLGGTADWVEATVALADSSDAGLDNLVEVINKLHKIGFDRKKMWLLFEHNPWLWTSSAQDVEASVAALKTIDGGKSLMQTIMCCPLLIGCSSQAVLNGLVWELARVGAEKHDLYNLLVLFQRVRESPRPIPEIVQQQCGLGGDEIRRRLSTDALSLAAEVNPLLRPAMNWFVKEGMKELEFWKMVLRRPSDFCRDTAGLDDQMDNFTSLGLSRCEALEILCKFTYSVIWDVGVAKEKIKYLVEEMHYPVQTVLAYPKFLSSSLDAKIKPRHKTIQFLESVGKMAKPTSLYYLSLSEEAFLKTYGRLHPGAIRVFKEKKAEAKASSGTRSQAENEEQDGEENSVAQGRGDDQQHFHFAGATTTQVRSKSSGIESAQVSPVERDAVEEDLTRPLEILGGGIEKSGGSEGSSTTSSASVADHKGDGSSGTIDDESCEVQQLQRVESTGSGLAENRDPRAHANGVMSAVMTSEAGASSEAPALETAVDDACFEDETANSQSGARSVVTSDEDPAAITPDSDENTEPRASTGTRILAFVRKLFGG